MSTTLRVHFCHGNASGPREHLDSQRDQFKENSGVWLTSFNLSGIVNCQQSPTCLEVSLEPKPHRTQPLWPHQLIVSSWGGTEWHLHVFPGTRSSLAICHLNTLGSSPRESPRTRETEPALCPCRSRKGECWCAYEHFASPGVMNRFASFWTLWSYLSLVSRGINAWHLQRERNIGAAFLLKHRWFAGRTFMLLQTLQGTTSTQLIRVLHRCTASWVTAIHLMFCIRWCGVSRITSLCTFSAAFD